MSLYQNKKALLRELHNYTYLYEIHWANFGLFLSDNLSNLLFAVLSAFWAPSVSAPLRSAQNRRPLDVVRPITCSFLFVLKIVQILCDTFLETNSTIYMVLSFFSIFFESLIPLIEENFRFYSVISTYSLGLKFVCIVHVVPTQFVTLNTVRRLSIPISFHA